MTDASRALTVLHATDLHLYADPQATLRDVNTLDSFRAVLAHMHAHHWPPDALMLTGDLAQDERAATYRRLRALLTPLGVPVVSLPGNHDDPAHIARFLGAAPLATPFETDLGAWRFVCLSTHVPGRTDGRLSEQTLAQLDAVLARDDGAHIALWLHHPPLPVGSAWIDRIGLANAAALLERVRGSRVRAVLAGHVHQRFETVRDGIAFVTTPSTCRQFLPASDTFAVDDRPPGYRVCRFFDDGRVTSEVEWVDQISTISKSSLPAPQSGQRQESGTSSQRVPGSMPSSGSPFSST